MKKLNFLILATAVLFLMLTTSTLFSGTTLSASMGGWHSEVVNNIFHAGFYGGATASTTYTSYNKAVTLCQMTVFRNGYGVITQGDDDEDITVPVSAQTSYSAPGYASTIPGTYYTTFIISATLHRPGYAPVSDTISFDSEPVSIVGTRVD